MCQFRFITDQLLDDPSLSVAAHCVAVLAIYSAVGLDGRADFGVGLELVADNMRAIYGAPMPRRKNGTLLHEAAAEGKERLGGRGSRESRD